MINEKAWKGGFKRAIGDESNPTLALALDNASKALHICDIEDAGTDWNVSADSNPSVYIHSATNPATEYLKLYHDATNAYIDGVGATALKLAIAGTAEIDLTATAFSPTTSDGNALGTTALMWADLFLASAGVINFNNGDVTLTHGSNLLTLAGGDLNVGDGQVLYVGVKATPGTTAGQNWIGIEDGGVDPAGTLTNSLAIYTPDAGDSLDFLHADGTTDSLGT